MNLLDVPVLEDVVYTAIVIESYNGIGIPNLSYLHTLILREKSFHIVSDPVARLAPTH
jgi:hypothetical protein